MIPNKAYTRIQNCSLSDIVQILSMGLCVLLNELPHPVNQYSTLPFVRNVLLPARGSGKREDGHGELVNFERNCRDQGIDLIV